MEGLKDVKGYEKEEHRSKHIIENMLFMVELNPVNCKVCRKIFNMIDNNVEPNIYNSTYIDIPEIKDPKTKIIKQAYIKNMD